MADKVGAAFGTLANQLQSPSGSYRKRLTGLSISAPSAPDGMDLANALGILGGSIQNEMSAAEQRKEKYSVAQTERLLKGASEEDLRKYRAVDLLTRLGDVELAHSPYAVTLAEKWRGEYLGAKAQLGYEQVVAQEGRGKTAAEEAERYDKYIRNQFTEASQVTSDIQAFTDGYYSNHMTNVLQQVKEQTSAASTDIKIARNGKLQSGVGIIAQKSLNLTPDEIKAEVQEYIRGAGVTGLSIGERIAFAKGLLNTIAAVSGSPDKVKALNDVELYTGDDGKPVLLGSVVDNTEAVQNAILTARRNNDSYVFQKRLEMQKLKPEEILPYMEEMKKNDPTLWQILSPETDNVYHNAVIAQQKAALRAAKLAARQAAKQQMNNIYEMQFTAHMNNQPTDGSYPVAQNIGGLPKASYVDENGNTVSVSATPEDTYDFLKNKLIIIYQNPNLSPQDKAKYAMRGLAWGPASGYVQAIKGQIRGAFDTADTNTMVQDMDMGSVRSALEMYEADNGTFGRLFPEETAMVQTIRTLRDFGKNTEEAMAIFTQGRDAIKDPTLKEQYEKNYKAQIQSSPSATIKGMDGEEATVPITDDSLLNSHLHTMVMYLQGAGYSTQTALQITQSKASENYWAYRGHIFPKAWFADLNVDDKGETALAFLDHERQALADYGGLGSPDNVFAVYNPYTDRVELKGNGVSAAYDRQNFTDQANQYAYNMYTQGQAMKRNTPLFPGETTIRAWRSEDEASADSYTYPGLP